MNSIALYIHIPWCVKKCPYCDFNSHALKNDTPEKQYISALLEDLQQDLKLLTETKTLSSIFIGGGTPSLFSADGYDLLLTGISQLIKLENNIEITLEANPGTFESQKFADYKAVGINRLSIGVQSFNNHHLKKLGRIHTAEEAVKAFDIARQAGFDNINLDLMFGLPEQQQEELLMDIKTAIQLQPSHISFYQLTLEPNTLFHRYPPRLPESELIYQAQQKAQQLLATADFQQYEISAYSQKNSQCRHNLNYWQFGDYLGIGAGAHGKLSLSRPDIIIRTHKHKNPEQYLNDHTAIQNTIAIDELALEYMMNQLRLKKGFHIDDFYKHTGLTKQSILPVLTDCLQQGLLIQHQQQYYCSKKGWNFLDSVLEKFIPE